MLREMGPGMNENCKNMGKIVSSLNPNHRVSVTGEKNNAHKHKLYSFSHRLAGLAPLTFTLFAGDTNHVWGDIKSWP